MQFSSQQKLVLFKRHRKDEKLSELWWKRRPHKPETLLLESRDLINITVGVTNDFWPMGNGFDL